MELSRELLTQPNKYSSSLQPRLGNMLSLLKGNYSQMAILEEPIAARRPLRENVATTAFGVLIPRDSSTKTAVRTAGKIMLIIFGQRAHTREGRLQVELAQIEYDLPRLARQWSHLSRQKGSVQQRGEGEKQIEVDRRLLRRQKVQLEEELEHVRTHRKLHRSRRKNVGAPVVALVGYTNAGKSTLLNRLAHVKSVSEDKLFATLDPMTKRVRFERGQEILLTDTVGFVQRLPTTLVAAFRATLEEVAEADLIIHVVDASSPTMQRKFVAV